MDPGEHKGIDPMCGRNAFLQCRQYLGKPKIPRPVSPALKDSDTHGHIF